MNTKPPRLENLLILSTLVVAGCSPTLPDRDPTRIPGATSTAAPATPTMVAIESPSSATDPYALISQETLFAYLEDLTAIQPFSGWRESGSEGEAEALDYVADQLGDFAFLNSLGLELERQSFHVFLVTEQWDSQVRLAVGGRDVDVLAGGLRSNNRDAIASALLYDSDGALNDSTHDPVSVEGPVLLVRSARDVTDLRAEDARGKILFVEYAAFDRALEGDQAVSLASRLVSKGPAGIVLVTQNSNTPDESHGSFVADAGAFNRIEGEAMPPTLYVRIEDLASAGIETWDDIAQIESARLTWDADVFSPGNSGNLIARIPGADASRAVILGAHIDSPNSPGAMDDGSGSAVLLEVARVMDAAQIRPAVDVYLVWFGSEELVGYGSSHFAATHQDLLDRTLAMLQIDMLSHPLDGIEASLDLVTWSYGQFGNAELTWPAYLTEAADRQGIEANPLNYYGLESDNSVFAGFDVPNANLIYQDDEAMSKWGAIHYAAHIHDPYDTVELASEVGDVLGQMAKVALSAALETGRDVPSLRVAPQPDRRALFVASHTESVHMAPTMFIEMGMALAWEGYDVDMIPYGQAVTAADLADADLVIALPVLDYPSPDGDPDLYDEAWTSTELDALEAYVENGGLLILANSAHRLKHMNRVMDPNEDWSDVNTLATRFGVTFAEGRIPGVEARASAQHPLFDSVTRLEMAEANGVPFTLRDGQVLAKGPGSPVVALIDHGEAGGQVLVLADVGLLGGGSTLFMSQDPPRPANMTFWQNLARFGRSR